MLSLKFKRMCSRVIASLSAMGFISIASSSEAEGADYALGTTYQPGEGFTYSIARATSLIGRYDARNGSCSGNTSNNVQAAGTYTKNNENTMGYCAFKCKSGTFFLSGSSYVTGFTVSGSPGAMITSASNVCKYLKPTCTALTNASSTTIGSDATGWRCQWTCKDGYSIGGGTGTNAVVTGAIATSVNQSMSSSSSCAGRLFYITLDCQEKGKIGGAQTATRAATYGQSFTISSDDKCTPNNPTAWSFGGWLAS